MTNYRQDNRSLDKFKQDILKSHTIEAKIAIALCCWSYDIKQKWPTLEPNGSDFTGQFAQDSKVSYASDYIIDGTPVEVTHSATYCKRFFHQKTGKIRRCIEDKSVLVFANNIKAKNIEFIALNAQQIDKYTNQAMDKYGEVRMPGHGSGITNKKAYRYEIKWFNGLWNILPDIDKYDLPQKYKKVIDVFKKD